MKKRFWLGVLAGLMTPMLFSAAAQYAGRNPHSFAGRGMTAVCQVGVDGCNTLAGICLVLADKARQAMPVEDVSCVPTESAFQIPAEPEPISIDGGSPLSELTPQDQQRIELIKSFLPPPPTACQPLDTILLPCMPKEITDPAVAPAGHETKHSVLRPRSVQIAPAEVIVFYGLMDLFGIGPVVYCPLNESAEESEIAAPACCEDQKAGCSSKPSCHDHPAVCPYSGKAVAAPSPNVTQPAGAPQLPIPDVSVPSNSSPVGPQTFNESKHDRAGIDTMEFRPSDAIDGSFETNAL